MKKKKPVDEVQHIANLNKVFRMHHLPPVPLRGPKFYPMLTANLVALSLLINELAGGEADEVS